MPPAGDLSPGRTRDLQPDGKMVYATPAGTATFDPAGTMTADGGSTSGKEMWVWIGLLAVSSGALAASKWNGLFDFFVVWGCAAAVVAQRWWRRPAVFGNPFGMPLDVLIGGLLFVAGAIYTLCYIPFFTLGHNFLDMVALQTEMFNYHDHLVATHPYASSWWQWPILERPISYFYHDYRTGAATNDPAACCVAEILALPNPFVWWFGLMTVPLVGRVSRGSSGTAATRCWSWRTSCSGCPGSVRRASRSSTISSPTWRSSCSATRSSCRSCGTGYRAGQASPFIPRFGVVFYLAVVVWAFAFFYPVLAGTHVTWDAWHARMWIGRWII